MSTQGNKVIFGAAPKYVCEHSYPQIGHSGNFSKACSKCGEIYEYVPETEKTIKTFFMNIPISKLCKKCADKVRAADKFAKRIKRGRLVEEKSLLKLAKMENRLKHL